MLPPKKRLKRLFNIISMTPNAVFIMLVVGVVLLPNQAVNFSSSYFLTTSQGYCFHVLSWV